MPIDGNENGDFLTRERAALGDDANLFSTPHDASVPSAQVDEDNLLDDRNDADDGGMSAFQSSFPSIDGTTNNAVRFPTSLQNNNILTHSIFQRLGAGGATNGSNAGSSRPYTPQAPTHFDDGEEPQVIKDWRERREQAIQRREDAAAARKEDTIKDAQKAVDEFYENYNNKRDKSIAQTRKDAEKFLESREDTTAGGTSWERIAKLVDLKGSKGGQGAAGGKERFRDLLGALVKDENAPGAKGY